MSFNLSFSLRTYLTANGGGSRDFYAVKLRLEFASFEPLGQSGGFVLTVVDCRCWEASVFDCELRMVMESTWKCIARIRQRVTG